MLGELLLVLIVAALVLGPKHLPSFAMKLGQYARTFRQLKEKFQTLIDEQIRHAELQQNITRAKAAESDNNIHS